jgi:hypothetical protein
MGQNTIYSVLLQGQSYSDGQPSRIALTFLILYNLEGFLIL